MSCCIVLLVGGSAHAGVLNGNLLAYDDNTGPGPGGSWSGTSPFASDGLQGYVDWAVFTEANFNLLFGGGGYTPTPGELVYTHQIFTTGPLVGATGMSIFLEGYPAGNGGSFDAGGVSGVDAATATADPFLADYVLVAETDPLTPSDGLAYSSPNRPQWTGLFGIIDGGQSAEGILPVGIPSANVIPEPASWLIASLVSVWLLLVRPVRRG
jgi:hypothetical protein